MCVIGNNGFVGAIVIVSGFYAECPSKNMYVSGSIWTKSKFLGLSLGVHNVGSGKTNINSLFMDVPVCIHPSFNSMYPAY